MAGKRVDYTGQKKNMLTFIKYEYRDKNGASNWKMKCDCGKEIICKLSDVNTRNKKSCGCTRTHVKNISGKKFGQLTVLNDYYVEDKHWTYWKCYCNACNTEKYIPVNNLRQMKTCGCQNHPKGNKSHSWKGYEDINGEFWGVLKIKARRREIKFNITIEYAWEIYLKQDKKCVFTGELLTFPRGGKYTFKDANISLDRIDSKKGYIKGNVQWVIKDINCMKWTKTNKEFVEMCQKVVDNNQLLSSISA